MKLDLEGRHFRSWSSLLVWSTNQDWKNDNQTLHKRSKGKNLLNIYTYIYQKIFVIYSKI